jgi:hypothetical protein
MTFTILKTMLSHTVSVLSSPLRGDRRGAGSIVFEDKVADVTNKNYELNLEVKSGIYFVEVIDTATNTYYKQKLVIQK